MDKYLSLLKSEPILLRLSTIQLIAYFGAWFSNVAIYTLLLSFEVDPKIIAFVAMLHYLAGVFQAPFTGAIIDRVKPKILMLILILLELISTLLLLSINDISMVWFLYIIIFVKMASASFYFTTEMSLLPKILPTNHLQLANELHSIIWSFSYTLGMAISGFVVYMLGVDVAFLIDAMMFFIAFILLYTLELEVVIQKTHETLLEMMKDSFAYLKRTPQAFHLMIAHSFVGLTAFDALVALMVERYYSSILAVSLAIGLIHASRALGLVVGPILLGSWISNKNIIKLFIAQAVAVWFWALLMHNFYLSLFASFMVGFFTTTLWSYTYTLLQKNIKEKYYGRIVAYNDMFFLSVAGLNSYLIGYFASKGLSLELITVMIGIGFVFGGVYFNWILKSYDILEISDEKD